MALQGSITTGRTWERVFVSLDLETTGLDPAKDAIIEVGAVKFRGGEVLDTFQTFVNPGRDIPEFIQRLTGISPHQVRRAPGFSSVTHDLRDFLEDHPIIGHNISFDLRFLESHGLELPNASFDTWDLASMLLPTTTEYSLISLARLLNAQHANPHRALEDSQATQEVFVSLLRKAEELDPGLLAHLIHLANRSQWGLGRLLAGLEPQLGGAEGGTAFGLTGLDLGNLSNRLGRAERRRTDPELMQMGQAKIENLLGSEGPFSKSFPGFEHRPEQLEMLAKVTGAIYQGNHLVVEGGTGVGKSMAYLLPAAIFAASQGQRVVISTNTINLQEQLIRKDIPAVTKVLEDAGMVEPGLMQAALLKGRANYLCLRRWNYLAHSESPSVDDARLLGKTSVWLQETSTGDRNEINLSGRDAYTWSKVSAGDKGWCPGLREGGACFLRTARERAEQAHIVVVNHALLLADMVRGGSLIPDYQYLIVDEAHNLEEEATRQLGFEITGDRLNEELEPLARLITQARVAMSGGELTSAVRQDGERALSQLEPLLPHARELWTRFLAEGERFIQSQANSRGEINSQLLVTQPMRRQRGWADLALGWENLDVALGQAVNQLARLQQYLDGADLASAEAGETLTMEAAGIGEDLDELRQQLGSVIGAADEQSIIWISRDPARAELAFHAAPLQVSGTLAENLFGKKECVVLTSATLSTQGNFQYLRERLGLTEGADELLVGSPFDYQRAALLMIPDDMPQPSGDRYIESLSRVISDLGRSLDGHTMALFTSHAALRAVAQQIRGRLAGEGIRVLAQGVDGSPQQLIRTFTENSKSVLLGTSSFWEGVDLPSGVLKALVLTRLPFQVPTDPIVKSRSEQYSDAFNDYSIPQAVLRFRQGMGRLIRNKGDKGAIVVLDRRVTGRSYGQAFLQSIPPCSLKPSVLANVGALAADWVK